MKQNELYGQILTHKKITLKARANTHGNDESSECQSSKHNQSTLKPLVFPPQTYETQPQLASTQYLNLEQSSEVNSAKKVYEQQPRNQPSQWSIISPHNNYDFSITKILENSDNKETNAINDDECMVTNLFPHITNSAKKLKLNGQNYKQKKIKESTENYQ